MSISFFVSGTPVGQPRARHARGVTYTPRGPISLWRGRIEFTAIRNRPSEPIRGPVLVNLVFVFPWPKRCFMKGALLFGSPIYHTSKPDRDNLDKAVLDVLTNLKFWNDDSHVCDGSISKIYGLKPGCHVAIRPLQ